MANEEARFWAKVRKSHDPNGCWLWTAATNGNGYGSFRVGSRTVQAHRWAYEHWIGPIPDGLEIDHLCRNHSCVRPSHLRAVTSQVNILAGESFSAQNARKTACPQGHPYSGDNLYIKPNGDRFCRACGGEANRRYRARKRAMGESVAA